MAARLKYMSKEEADKVTDNFIDNLTDDSQNVWTFSESLREGL